MAAMHAVEIADRRDRAVEARDLWRVIAHDDERLGWFGRHGHGRDVCRGARGNLRPPAAPSQGVGAGGRFAGTETTASPSSTSLPSTRASHCRRTTRPFSTSSTTSTDDLDHVADLHRAVEIERLRAVDGAGSGQPGAEHGGNQARRVEPVRDALAEPGVGRIDVAEMQRIVVAGEPREADHVGIHHGLHQALAHADMQVLETEDAKHARIDRLCGHERIT